MKDLILSYATKYGLDPAVVYGVCMTESSLNPKATRYEKDFIWLLKPGSWQTPLKIETSQQKTSWGIMQVMGAVLRELGYNPAGAISDILHSVENQLDYGCRFLARKIRRYDRDAGIAAYNAGSPRRTRDGKYVNQDYVDKVLKYAEDWADG